MMSADLLVEQKLDLIFVGPTTQLLQESLKIMDRIFYLCPLRGRIVGLVSKRIFRSNRVGEKYKMLVTWGPQNMF